MSGQLLAVKPVQAEVGRAELGLVVREGPRPAALADRQDVLLDRLAGGRLGVEGLGDELDLAALAVGELEQLVLDVGDADVARADIVDRVRPRRPHLGEIARGEQAVLHFLRHLEELAALDGHHLHAADVALVVTLPYHLAAVPLPAAVVDPDRYPRTHEVGEDQREGQADRPAAADRDPQDRLRLGRLGDPLGVRHHGHRARVDRLEGEPVVRDLDLIAGPQPLRAGDEHAVHPGAVGAAAVGDHKAIGLLAQFRVHPGDRGIGDHDVVVLAAPEGDRRVADRKTLSGKVAMDSNDSSFHRASPVRRLARPIFPAGTVSPASARLHAYDVSFPRQYPAVEHRVTRALSGSE